MWLACQVRFPTAFLSYLFFALADTVRQQIKAYFASKKSDNVATHQEYKLWLKGQVSRVSIREGDELILYRGVEAELGRATTSKGRRAIDPAALPTLKASAAIILAPSTTQDAISLGPVASISAAQTAPASTSSSSAPSALAFTSAAQTLGPVSAAQTPPASTSSSSPRPPTPPHLPQKDLFSTQSLAYTSLDYSSLFNF